MEPEEVVGRRCSIPSGTSASALAYAVGSTSAVCMYSRALSECATAVYTARSALGSPPRSPYTSSDPSAEGPALVMPVAARKIVIAESSCA